jgi:amino acid transporter
VTRGLEIFLATLATVIGILAFLFIPLSIVVGHPVNVIAEVAIVAICGYYVARVMRADRLRRREAEASLPPERRRPRRAPRRPITFQVRETLVTFVVWFVLVAGFNALVLGIDAIANAGIAIFAAFMLATLTITGRHMMFRLTTEEDD